MCLEVDIDEIYYKMTYSTYNFRYLIYKRHLYRVIILPPYSPGGLPLEVHEKMVCWCETNEKEKTKAIEDGGLEIQRLKAFLGEAAGKIAELKVSRKDTNRQ